MDKGAHKLRCLTLWSSLSPTTTPGRIIENQKLARPKTSIQVIATRHPLSRIEIIGGFIVSVNRKLKSLGALFLGAAVTLLAALPAAHANELTAAVVQPTPAGAVGLAGEAQKDAGYSGYYIVQLDEPPVATYMGEIDGYAATSNKATGANRLNTDSKNSRKYANFLRQQQRKVIDDSEAVLGRSIEANYQYQFVFNGFAAVMTADEAKALQSMNGVKSVFRDRNYSMTTDVGPEFIDAPAVLSGPPNNVGHSMGEGIVIAILDSGINSDHPSF
ncbi:MAG: S8 family serine peptidase, partial [Woeseiaceae bacterium]|nr:S8 family serine peptidase [Woeseiaceae bacterium]